MATRPAWNGSAGNGLHDLMTFVGDVMTNCGGSEEEPKA